MIIRMRQPIDPYAELSSLRQIAQAYGNGLSLDAKWEVMRRPACGRPNCPRPPGARARFTLENGAELLGKAFDEVTVEIYDGGFAAPSADPVFAYYAATELYRAHMRDESIPLDTRLRIAPVFVHLTQQIIETTGQPLRVRKEIGAFRCR
jgi:hypothetical protein